LPAAFAPNIIRSSRSPILILIAALSHPDCRATLSTTARYTRVADNTIRSTTSPLDRLRLEVVPPA
jgi:hypothetical protein